MPITKIKKQNLAADAVTADKISQALFAEITSNSNSATALLTTAAAAVNAVPSINTISYTNSSYYVVDDTAANTGGGYIKITGANFNPAAQVIIDTTNATSVSYINSTTLHVQVPAKSAATYTVYVVNTDGSTAIKPLGITYSANPLWVTGSTLANVQANQAFTGSFSATGATSYAVASGSSLPTGMTLVTANGYYYGNISIGTETTYNFDITASDAENQDSTRSFSLIVTVGAPPGQVAYTTAGSYTWTVPAGVTSVCVVCVGGGGGGGGTSSVDGAGGGGGGGLGYKNNISVTPGASVPLVVGAGGTSSQTGGTSYFSSPSVVEGRGGTGGTTASSGTGGGGGGYTGDGGGNGGQGGNGTSADSNNDNVGEGGGGGGAGGYSGNGGNGWSTSTASQNGNGGGGGGGGSSDGGGGGGGGVGLLGQGTSGTGGGYNSPSYSNGGSGGANGTATGPQTSGVGFNGGDYGGGGGGVDSSTPGGTGGVGAVRIIWGSGRSFPTTQTGDL